MAIILISQGFRGVDFLRKPSVYLHFKAFAGPTSYADDVLNLVVAQGYLSKLLANDAVSRFIEQHRQDIYEQFKSIALMNSLDS